jgi:hypothetical protein
MLVGAAQTYASGQYRIDGVELNRTFDSRQDNASAGPALPPTVETANTQLVTRRHLARVDVSGFHRQRQPCPIAGATIELVSDSVLGRTKFYSGTDGGHFTFSGIPQGTYSVSSQDPVTKLSGSNQGQIATED